jgi:glycine oxidase
LSRHAVIVGGGIVGCMTAMELLQRGYRVTIVERNQIASQTSGESSWAGGGILFPLLPWHYRAEVNALTLEGMQRYPKILQHLQQQTDQDSGYIQSGFLLLPPFDEAAAKAWAQASQQAWQMPQHSASAGQIAEHLMLGALLFPEVAQVRPPYLMQALRQYLQMHQVTMLEHTELSPLRDTGPLNAWQTLDGRWIEADQFVVTSGAWSFQLLQSITDKLNIKPMRGQILLYQPAQNVRHIVYHQGCYLIPRADGYLLAGSTLEDVGFDNGVTQQAKLELAQKAEAIMPSLQGLPILKHWSGLRPGTPDNLPIISRHPQIENLFINTGHFRYGLTMAPASARRVADLMSHQNSACALDQDLSAYQLI